MSRPSFEVIDAREHGLDESGLREAARRACASRPGHASRSYRWPLALVASWDGPVGVDIERIDPGVPDRVFAESICTPEERAVLGPRRFEPEVVASLWSGKEALAKALGDALHYEPHRLASPLTWREGRSGRWRAAPLDIAPGHVAWLCWT